MVPYWVVCDRLQILGEGVLPAKVLNVLKICHLCQVCQVDIYSLKKWILTMWLEVFEAPHLGIQW